MLIGQFDRMMTYYVFHARDFFKQNWFYPKGFREFFVTFEVSIDLIVKTVKRSSDEPINKFIISNHLNNLFVG